MSTDTTSKPDTKPDSKPGTAEQTAGPVSRHCARGKHTRCLGTVYIGRDLTDCACTCGDHGTEMEKSRR